MNTLTRWALRCYPPSFRDRYGDEIAALVDDLGERGVALNLWLGVVRAWVRPTFAGAPERRMATTVATTWVAWCAAFLIVPAVNRSLLDPVAPGVDTRVRIALDVAVAFWSVGWACCAIGGLVLIAQGALPAVRARDWAVLRPLAPVAILGVVAAATTLALALRTHSPGNGDVGLGIVWLVSCVCFVVALGFGPASTIRRLAVTAASWRASVWLSAAVASALAVMVVASLLAVVMAGDAALFAASAPVYAALSVAGIAAVVAATSVTRGMRATLLSSSSAA